MILLTVREHFFSPQNPGVTGPNGPKVRKERTLAFASDMRWMHALARIKAYEQAYRDRYGAAGCIVEFSLLSVGELSGAAKKYRDILGGAQVLLVEDLATRASEFDK